MLSSSFTSCSHVCSGSLVLPIPTGTPTPRPFPFVTFSSPATPQRNHFSLQPCSESHCHSQQPAPLGLSETHPVLLTHSLFPPIERVCNINFTCGEELGRQQPSSSPVRAKPNLCPVLALSPMSKSHDEQRQPLRKVILSNPVAVMRKGTETPSAHRPLISSIGRSETPTPAQSRSPMGLGQ